MSTLSGLPDESWSEEKILELLKDYASGSSVTAREGRLVCLDELLRRRTIKQVDEAMEILLKMAKEHRRSDPESSMIIKLISKLVNSEDSAFQALLSTMCVIEDRLLYCFAKIVRNLDDVKKRMISARRLLYLLMVCNSFTSVTNEMYQTLVTMDNKRINKEIVETTLPHLRSPDPFKVVYAVRIVSRLASADIISELELVIKRALTGWYNGYYEEILTNICSYFKRVKDEESIPYLLQIFKSGFNREQVTSKALASVIDTHPKAIIRIWEFLEKEKEHYSPILMAFEEMETRIDVERLFSILDIDLSTLLHFSLPKQTLKNIVIKSGKQAKPLLLKMIKDKDQDKYTFARECLEEIGVSIEEYSKVFEKPPILQVYEFFYEKKKGMLLENLWKEQDKLRNRIRGFQRIEYFIQNLFSVLDFVTLFVDPSGKEGVDVVAFSPNEPYILIIGCTTSVIKDDLKK